MNHDENDKKDGSKFRNLPTWPSEAQDIPDSNPTEPPRAKLKWMLSLGVMGAVLFGLLSGTDESARFVGGAIFGFIAFSILGVIVEYYIFNQERRRRRWENH